MGKNFCVVCEYGWIIVGVEDGTDELDPIGDVNIRISKVLFEIPCEW